MPQSTNSRRDLLRLVLFTFAAWGLWALGKDSAKPEAEVADATETAPEAKRARSGFSKRRLATSLAFATLFFAGAAFSAGAGDLVVGAVEGTTDAAQAETTTDGTDTVAPADSGQADPAPPADPASAGALADPADPAAGGQDSGSSSGGGSAGQPSDPADPGSQPSDDGAAPASGGEGGSSAGNGGSNGGSGNGGSQPAPQPQPDPPAAGPGSESHAGDQAVNPASHASPVDVNAAHDSAVAAEAAGSWGTFWLHRALPDPTPPARRLKPGFARTLASVSKNQHVDWALVLGVVRARGHTGRVPTSRHALVRVASSLRKLHAAKSPWQAVLGLEGRTAFADRAIALRNYNRAVGLWTLVRGLVASKNVLEKRVLDDRRINIYAGGRSDVASGRVDVRVLALIRYMAVTHGEITVSCLVSGHRLYARPGVVSAHIYGEAVDISALGNVSIYGNQQPGGLTEKAVRNILLLPAELRPKQVISLLGLGGPSFALADHYDHIHVGY